MLDPTPCASGSPRSCSFVDSKRQVHLTSERRRRESIRNGYLELKALVPVNSNNMGTKLTNAVVLSNAVEYLRGLREKVAVQGEEIKRLTTQTLALGLISQNYAQLSVEEHLMSDEASVDRLSFAKYNLVSNALFVFFSVATWFRCDESVLCILLICGCCFLFNRNFKRRIAMKV
ncbi:unnamed protein product [Soboliphyme baturini]|uniref:BHLH domain-containing protein n=1 Tax=Soboliphyme baturini TaxID=241478 RepID=A0A183IKM2_9BILA|nr:unnamed protein product [Soboliphyme baturini]